MTEFARRLRDHVGAPENRVRVVVPEWADVIEADSRGDPAVYSQTLTAVILEELAQWPAADEREFAAHIVLRMAESEDGERLFDAGDKSVLLAGISSDVLLRLAESIVRSISREAA